VRKFTFILFLFVLIVSCRNNEARLPDGYLTQTEMVPIVVDIHLIEGARSGTLILGDTNKLPDYYAKIYEKHNVSDAKFKESFDWYAKNPEKLKLVYEAAIVELSKIEVEINNRKKVKGDPGKNDHAEDANSAKVMPVDSLKR